MKTTYSQRVAKSGDVLDDNVGEMGDASFGVVGYCVHHGSAHITEYVVHPEGEGGIELDDFSDQFSVIVGPAVNGFKDVSGHGVMGL